MGGGGGGKQTSETKPWIGAQPYLTDLMSTAQDIFRQGYGQQYYPGQQVAGFSPMTQMGLGGMTQFGMQQSPAQMAMGRYITGDPRQVSGRGMDYTGGPVMPGSGFMPGQSMTPYFSGNPHLDAMVNTSIGRAGEAIQEQVMPGIAAQFGGMGRTGGGIQQEMMENVGRDFGRTAGEMASGMYGRAYETGMDRDLQRRQLEAQMLGQQAGMAPDFQQMQMNQLNQLLRGGAITEDQAQRMIDAERAKFDFYQQAPMQALQQYSGIVQGMPSNLGTTTTGGGQGSRLAGALGGAMAGSSFGMPGMILGGLGGLL